MKYEGPKRNKGLTIGQFFVDEDGSKYFKIKNGYGRVIFVPISLIDKLREDEWDYDSSIRTRRKDFLTCA